jgi:C4-dicarboxylate-specific signal transduction histidine kinase
MLRDRLQGLRQENQQGVADDALISRLDKCIRDAEVIVTNALKLSDNIKNMMNKRLHEDEDAPQMISINQLIREELQFLEADMKFKHEITKTCALDESLPAVKGVYHHFSQSIVQIIRNILDSLKSADKKELTITSKRDGSAIHLEFRDSGLDRGNSCNDSCAVRLENVTELLKPYGAILTVVRSPNNNLHTISIPCVPAG